MRRGMRRFSVWVGLVLLLVLVVMSGCSRSKSSGPPEGTEGDAASEPTQSPGEPVPSISFDAATNATATALLVTATAEAQATQAAGEEPQATAVPEETAVPTAEPTEATPEPESSAEPETTPEAEELPPTAGATTYTVKTGETLFRIALNHGLTYQALAAHNGITNPNLIYPGQELKIPAAGETPPSAPAGDGYYTVQAGDNLFRISLKYNMLFTTLAAANGLSYPYTIYPGQRLTIP